MLVPISKSSLSDTEKIGVAMIRSWDAVDVENVVYLKQTAGRGKYGLPKFLLIAPDPKPAQFSDILQAYCYPDFVRSVIRAWSLDEAIEIANQRLPKLLKRRRTTLAPDKGQAGENSSSDDDVAPSG